MQLRIEIYGEPGEGKSQVASKLRSWLAVNVGADTEMLCVSTNAYCLDREVLDDEELEFHLNRQQGA